MSAQVSVGEVVKQDGNIDNAAIIQIIDTGIAWAGAVITENQYQIPITADSSLVTANFYSDNSVPVLLKLEDENNHLTAETQAIHPGGGWHNPNLEFR